MGKILIPATKPEDWQQLLADPEKHWRKGYSARTLAHCWQEANGLFPSEVQAVLSQSPELADLEMLLAIPEHQVHLPGGRRPSQNDVWVLARTTDALVSIAVEGKVSEAFGPTVGEWLLDQSPGKEERLRFLCGKLDLDYPPPNNIRYQLIHRTVSALIEAEQFHAKHAVMIVHSFSQEDKWFDDYERFLSLFGARASLNEFVTVRKPREVKLHFAWVRGEKRFLES